MAKTLTHERYLRFFDRGIATGGLDDARLLARLAKHLANWKECLGCLKEAERGWLPLNERHLLNDHSTELDAMRAGLSPLARRLRFHNPNPLSTILLSLLEKQGWKQEQVRVRAERLATEERLTDFLAHPEKYWCSQRRMVPTTYLPDEEVTAIMEKNGVPNFSVGPCDLLLWDNPHDWPAEVERFEVRPLTREIVDENRLPPPGYSGPPSVSIHDGAGEYLLGVTAEGSLHDALLELTDEPEKSFILEYWSRAHELPDRCCNVLSITVYTFSKSVTLRAWVNRHLRRPTHGPRPV